MTDFPRLPALVWRVLFLATLVAVCLLSDAHASDCGCPAASDQRLACVHVAQRPVESWLFARGRYTHDPDTGGRVAQYAMKPPVEPLPDQRAVTSGYSRTRTVLRGANGSATTSYRVQSYGNGRGGLDAEWERFHDAWRGSTLAGGNFQTWGQLGWGTFGGPGGYGPGGNFPPIPGRPGLGGGPNYGPGHSPGGRFPGHGHRNQGRPDYWRPSYGPGTGRPDAGRLDPDGADGYRDRKGRTPDRQFFNQAVPMPPMPDEMPPPKPKA